MATDAKAAAVVEHKEELPPTPSPNISIFRIPYLIWAFTENNVPTFVVPNAAFGIIGALAGPLLQDGPAPTARELLLRVPVVIAFNWLNTLITDLANQTSPGAVEEDKINKPWRPIPAGLITFKQTRRALLYTIPTAMLFNWAVGVWNEGLLIIVLTYLYNDLCGGDELTRDIILGAAFSMFNMGSLRLAIGSHVLTGRAIWWTVITGAAIGTTVQVQDMKDMEGDRLRGRCNVVLLFGETFSRSMIAACVLAWSFACGWFWDLAVWGYVFPVGVGAYVAFRALALRGKKEDTTTWRSWCLWTVCLYLMPLVARMAGRKV